METTPLAERLRPKKLDEYVGQKHLVGETGVLKTAISKGVIPSMIFWGPPGVGKTTLAYLIANTLKRPFFTLSAVNSGVKDVREAIEKAKKSQFFGTNNPILFIDEIHRFSKSQQDSLLGAVEKGVVTLIGATTENPGFEVISALQSRCQVYVLEPLSKDELIQIADNAVKSDVVLSKLKIKIEAYDNLLMYSGGDARKLLNLLELCVNNLEGESRTISNDFVERIAQKQFVRYDKGGDQHYDIISAFIKSIRGSDPNAAVYWLARMVEGGEDPLFIARRLLILASEDIGNANPNALLLANNCFQAVNSIGWPESRIILSQAVIYLAASPKSNSAYKAISDAQELVRKTGNLPVLLHLRNAPVKLMKELNYGKDYQYSHSYENNFSEQEYLPEEISGSKLFEPSANVREEEMKKHLSKLWKDKYGY